MSHPKILNLTLIYGLLLLQILNIICLELVNSQDIDTLKLVFLIHRHGDRTPIETYPRDPYRNVTKYWPDGLGRLTLDGKKRMYNLGKYLAKRYEGFLGKTPREVYVRSSGIDRCLESTSLVLSGLYPPKGRWKWNENLGQQWQPFPIKTVPPEDDGMLVPGSQCKRGEEILADIFNSPEVIEYYEKMKSTLLYVQDNTGYEKVDLIKAEEIFDQLFIEKIAKYQLPAWVDDNVYQKLKEIADKFFIFSGMTKQIQYFRAGLLLGEIWQHISEAETEEKPRLFIYSSHDTLISVFLSALNEFNGLAPPFGSSVILELHQNHTTNEQYIQAYYLNVTETEKPYQLKLSKCRSKMPSSCTITNFHEMIQDLIPSNWQKECQNSNPTGPSDAQTLYLALATVALTFWVMFILVYLWLNNRRHGTWYRLLPIN